VTRTLVHGLAAAAAALLLASCLPPFDADASLAAAVIGKLRTEATVETQIYRDEDSAQGDLVFIPTLTAAGVDVTRGFIRQTDTAFTRLAFTYIDGGGSRIQFWNQTVASTWSPEPDCPVNVVTTLKTGDDAVVIHMDPAVPGAGWLNRYQANFGNSSLDTLGSPDVSFSAAFGAWTVLGASIPVSANPASDSVSWLLRDASGTYEQREHSTLNFSGASGLTTIDTIPAGTLTAIPSGVTRCMYYRDAASGYSYASFAVGGAWQCWRWEPGGTPNQLQLAAVTSRVDALLTDGRLLCATGGSGKLYDPDGALAASFPLGGLRFSCEAIVDGTPRVFFSLKLILNGYVSLRLYSIPTADLAGLTW
jgi:hypothetical protein